MRSISQSCLLVVAVALAFCFSARLAYADGESISGCAKCNGYSFTASITQVGTTSTYQVKYTITNNSGPAAVPYNWSLTAFNNGDIVSSVPGTLSVTGSNGLNYSSSTDYVVAGGKSNNGNTNCNGTLSYAFCVQQSGTGSPPTLYTGESLIFKFDLTCSSCGLMNSWDFLSSGNSPGTTNGNVYAITNWGTSTSMPEPSVAFLYASTLAVGLILAWRSRSVRRPTKS